MRAGTENGLYHAKTCLQAYVETRISLCNSNHSLIRALTVRLQNYWILKNVWMESKCQDDTLCMCRTICTCAFCTCLKALFRLTRPKWSGLISTTTICKTHLLSCYFTYLLPPAVTISTCIHFWFCQESLPIYLNHYTDSMLVSLCS